MNKRCSKCYRTLPVSAFGSHSRQKSGLQSRCRECINLDPSKSRLRLAQGRRAHTNEAGELVKTCSQCFDVKSVTEFHRASAASRPADGFMARCKACTSKQDKARRAAVRADPVASAKLTRKEEQRRIRLRYGVSLETVEVMKLSRDYRCDICDQKMDGRREKALHVDHCHGAGDVRGMLCGDCNRGLGCFHDDPARLQRAIAYLESWKKQRAA